jgi:hypothetical protein
MSCPKEYGETLTRTTRGRHARATSCAVIWVGVSPPTGLTCDFDDHDSRCAHLFGYYSVPHAFHTLLTIGIAVNTSGIARLTKFYTPLHRASGAGTPQALVHKIFTLVSRRAPGLCNFLDAPELAAELNTGADADGPLRVVYRNYATLYFVFVVDAAESELGVLDLIQVRAYLMFFSRARLISLAGVRRVA